MSECVFCEIVEAERSFAPQHKADVVKTWARLGYGLRAVAFVPLNPVAPGHTLIVPADHVDSATENPKVTAMTMQYAAQFAKELGDCNIITSVGEAATQSIFHLHIHVVPRSEGDGLSLPWTGQASDDKTQGAE